MLRIEPYTKSSNEPGINKLLTSSVHGKFEEALHVAMV